jgi:hypothetical protein
LGDWEFLAFFVLYHKGSICCFLLGITKLPVLTALKQSIAERASPARDISIPRPQGCDAEIDPPGASLRQRSEGD